eukprot:COSAG06_NODE_62581_length_264_cov_1.490909_2_plen_33_part_01
MSAVAHLCQPLVELSFNFGHLILSDGLRSRLWL